MKTLKLIIGIISIVLFVVITLQSCVVGIGNALTDSEEVSGTAGFLLAVFLLIGGIVTICTRKSRAGGIVSACFFLFGSVIGLANYGTYADLRVWSIVSLLFGISVFIASLFTKSTKKAPAAKPESKNEEEAP